MSFVFPWRAGHFDEAFIAVMRDSGTHPHERLALKAAANPLDFRLDRRCSETSNPAARDLIRLPGGIIICVLHTVNACGDHFADQPREGRRTRGIECRSAISRVVLLEADQFSSAVFLDEINP